MRYWVPVLAVLVLAAGCSKTGGGESQPTKLTPLSNPPSRSSSQTSTSTVAAPTTPPAPGAPIDDVIAWIKAGQSTDIAPYHTVTYQGTESTIGADVAFVTPSGKTRCMTDSKNFGGDLACLVNLKNPPPRPPDFPTHWQANWVEFDGPSITVGSPHGDPGRFATGDGPQLPYGHALKFGDYQCRIDEVGLYCLNNAHQSAARFNDAGIEPFGCLKSVTPPPNIGIKFSC